MREFSGLTRAKGEGAQERARRSAASNPPRRAKERLEREVAVAVRVAGEDAHHLGRSIDKARRSLHNVESCLS